MRMKCCLASSRENTMTLAGSPSRPLSSRRTSTLPNEPVPPVIRMRLPLNGIVYIFSPNLVRCWVLRQMGRQFMPWRRAQARVCDKSVAFHTAIAKEFILGLDITIQLKGLAEQAQQFEL